MDLVGGKEMNASGSAKVIRVGAVSGDSLDIDFDNGSILLLSVRLILSLPGVDVLAEDDRIYYPKTDGRSIYWRDGPRPLSVAEILALAGSPGNGGNG